MYILCVVIPEGDKRIVRYVGRTKGSVMQHIPGNCLAWRLHDGKDWCDGTENAWKWIVNEYGPAEIVQ